MTTNRLGWTFTNGFAIPPVSSVPTDTRHAFEPSTDEPLHVRDTRPIHADNARVMETLVEPVSADFRYSVNQYVYVHEHAYATNPLDAVECRVLDVTAQPLEIVVTPCNRPDVKWTVSADKLSAPIYV
jgi:hypothetical protein